MALRLDIPDNPGSICGDGRWHYSRKVAKWNCFFVRAFCHRWNLYGMQGDTPLLLKLSVNLTPHGSMIFIPASWSFDPKRDIKWKAITALHQTRVPKPKGRGLRESRKERLENAAKARVLIAEAKKLGLKGGQRHEFVCKGLRWS